MEYPLNARISLIPKRADLAEFLASLEFFRELDANALRALAEAMETLTLAAGTQLIEQGEPDQNLYVIWNGTLAVTARGRKSETEFLVTATRGETVGGLGLLSSDTSAIDATAVDEARVLILSRAAFREISEAHPSLLLQLMHVVTRRFRQTRLLSAIHVSRLFGELDEIALRDLEAELELELLTGGSKLFGQGETGDSLCIVVSGRLRVIVEKAHGKISEVAELGVGEVVGEMALVSDQPRSATVYAIRDSEVARLSREGFDRFISKHPHAGLRTFTKQVVTRLNEQLAGGAPKRRGVSTIAVIPAGDDVALRRFCEELAKSMAGLGSTLHLMGSRLDAALGKLDAAQTPNDGPGDIGVAEWLSRQEMEFQYVLYEADAKLTGWTQRCVRQADLILVVGNAKGNPQPGAIEREILARLDARVSARMALALLHGAAEREPENTKAWLEARRVASHYHVRENSQADYDRVARLITGKGVGLVLGGGFARGLAHLGVIRAMQELGVPIDAIGGTSMGGMMAAGHAVGLSVDQILRETCARSGKFFRDFTLPLVAVQQGTNFSAVMKEFFGTRQIEDLWMPFYCVSANLNRSEMKVHTQGSLAKAIMATTRAPAIFPPIVYDGELHVDGGLLNNVPVDVMRSYLGSGTVIGVDVSPPVELDPMEDYGEEVSGWRVAWNRLRPFGKKRETVPSMLQVLMRTLEFGGISFNHTHAAYADLYMRPPLLEFDRSDFGQAKQIAAVGHEYAKSSLREWMAENAGGVTKARAAGA